VASLGFTEYVRAFLEYSVGALSIMRYTGRASKRDTFLKSEAYKRSDLWYVKGPFTTSLTDYTSRTYNTFRDRVGMQCGYYRYVKGELFYIEGI